MRLVMFKEIGSQVKCDYDITGKDKTNDLKIATFNEESEL